MTKNYKRDFKKYGVILLFICITLVSAILLSSCGNNASENETEASANQPPKKEYNIPPASEENDLLKIATSVYDTDAKICYLTFDDGPTKEVTPKVLDVLKEYDVKATFFMLGKMIDANPDIAKRVASEGHLLSNHSYYHNYEDLYATADSFIAEIEKTQQAIENITGEESFKLMRFPGGSHNAGSYASAKQEYKNVLREKGYYYVDWNCLNGDAEAALRSAEQLISRTKETAIGRNIVVLMHDAAAKTTTPDALGSIIEYLRGQGYQFKRLDEIEYYDKTHKIEENNALIL